MKKLTQEQIENVVPLLLSIYNTLKSADNNKEFPYSNQETLSEMFFRRLEHYNLNLNDIMEVDYLKPVKYRENDSIILNIDYLIYSFRYALGRMTPVVREVSDKIIENWDRISPEYRRLMQKEIKYEIERGGAGMKCDVEDWERILKLKA